MPCVLVARKEHGVATVLAYQIAQVIQRICGKEASAAAGRPYASGFPSLRGPYTVKSERVAAPYIRVISEPYPYHCEVYAALKLDSVPLNPQIIPIVTGLIRRSQGQGARSGRQTPHFNKEGSYGGQ